MPKRFLALALVLGLTAVPNPSWAKTISRTFHVDLSSLSLQGDEELRIQIQGLAGGAFRPGEPDLPSLPVVLPLDYGTRVASVEVIPLETQEIALDRPPAPTQVASAWKQGDRVELQADLARDPGWFPRNLEGPYSTGYMRGRPLASVLVTPVQWHPRDNVLLVTTHFRVVVEVEEDASQHFEVLRESPAGHRSFNRAYRTVTGAPETPGLTATAVNSGEPFAPTFRPTVDGSPVEMVIITSTDQVSEYQRLADFKTQLGLTAVVRDIDWIKANYRAGSDIQETIRNFIKDAVQKWGTTYIVLGGDNGTIPVRYGFTKYYGSESIPSDGYFSDLDSNWNQDGDAVYGEGYFNVSDPGDQVDLYPDVWVGRLPSNNLTEAQVLVDKTLSYQETPTLDGYLNDYLLLGEVLFPQDWTLGESIVIDGADYCEDLVDSLQGQHNPVRLYENYTAFPSSSPLDFTSAIGAINTGHHLIHHVGHGYINTMSLGLNSDTMQNADAEALTNASKLSVLYAINCTSCAVDYNSISESWMRNPNGGAAFVIGSTRWDFPTTGSQYQDEFFSLLLQQGVTRLGEAMALSKVPFVPSAFTDNAHRWTQFTQVSLGDPSMDFWTDNPITLAASHAATYERDSGTYAVDVTDGGSPVAGALVTLYKDGDAFGTGTTDGAGHVEIPFNPDTDGTFSVGAVKHNAVPYLGQATVTSPPGPYLYASSQGVDDNNSGSSSGNDDGRFDSGETVELGITLSNSGSSGATGITAVLSTSDPYLTILDPNASYNPIGAAGSSAPYDEFLVAVSSDAPDRHQATCTLNVTSNEGSFNQDLQLYLHSPEFEYRAQTVRDSVGNGDSNGLVGANEDFAILSVVQNLGLGLSSGLELRLRTTDPAVTITDSISVLGDLASGDIGSNPADGFAARFSDVDSVHTMSVVAIDDEGERAAWTIDIDRPDTVTSPLTFGDASSISLKWTPVSDDDLWGYNVYRGPTSSGPFTRINLFTTDYTSYYQDAGLPGLTRFYYRIAAVDESGNEGEWSEVVTGTTSLELKSGWPVEMYSASTGGITLADLDGDGSVEVLGAAEEIYAMHADGTEFNDGDVEVRTLGPIADTQEALFWNTPAVGDIDNDGIVEVAGIGWIDHQLWLVEVDGTVEPGWPKDANPLNHASPNPLGSVCFADCNADGTKEILATVANLILAWNPDGTEVMDGDSNPGTDGVFAVTGSAFSYGTPSVADIDGDLYKEVIAGMRDGFLYVFDHTGASYPGFPINLGGNITGSAAVGDLGSDGIVEIVIPSSNNLLNAVRADGSQAPGFPVGINFSADVDASPALGDFDGNGTIDVIISAGDGLFHAINGATGASLPGFPVPITNTLGKPVEVRGSPVMADVDGDGSRDTVFGDYNGLLHAYDNQGNRLDGFPIQTGNLFENAPAVWDVDGDGLTEVVAESFDQNIYMWETPWVFNESLAVWPMFKRNQGNTGELAADVFVTGVEDDRPRVGMVLGQNAPNPVLQGSTTIRYRVPDGSGFQRVELSVYDISGRLVRRLVDGEQLAGDQEITWDTRNSRGRRVAAGMYAYRLVVGDQVLSRKMLIAR